MILLDPNFGRGAGVASREQRTGGPGSAPRPSPEDVAWSVLATRAGESASPRPIAAYINQGDVTGRSRIEFRAAAEIAVDPLASTLSRLPSALFVLWFFDLRSADDRSAVAAILYARKVSP